MRRLASRIGKDGLLRVISQQTRSQVENKELAVERFVELMGDALRQVPNLFLPFRSTFDVLTSERFLDSKKIRHSSTSLEGN